MRLSPFVPALLFLLAAAPASAGNWSIGTDWSFAIWNPQEAGSDNLTIIALPGHPIVSLPGFRLGFADSRMKNEFYLDGGVSILSEDETLTNLLVTGNYQYNFQAERTTTPYLTAGLGLYSVSFAGTGATSAVFGGGVGIRNRIADGHGSFRVEFRVDKISEGEDAGAGVIDEALMYGVKLGVDFWMK